MNLFYQALLLAFVAVARADSSMFSQFIGATTVPATFAGDLVASATICTNYLHGLPNTSGLPVSGASQVFQQEVDGVCQFCTSLGQTRVDNCCGQASSSACFASFGGDVQPVTATAASAITATAPATAATGGVATSTKSGSDAERSAVVRINFLDVLAYRVRRYQLLDSVLLIQDTISVQANLVQPVAVAMIALLI